MSCNRGTAAGLPESAAKKRRRPVGSLLPSKPPTGQALGLRASREDLLKIPETALENSDDEPCVRSGVALATDRGRHLDRVSAHPAERPHPAAAGIDRAATRVAPAGTAAGGRWPDGRHGRAGLRAAGPHRIEPQTLRVPWPGRVAD